MNPWSFHLCPHYHQLTDDPRLFMEGWAVCGEQSVSASYDLDILFDPHTGDGQLNMRAHRELCHAVYHSLPVNSLQTNHRALDRSHKVNTSPDARKKLYRLLNIDSMSNLGTWERLDSTNTPETIISARSTVIIPVPPCTIQVHPSSFNIWRVLSTTSSVMTKKKSLISCDWPITLWFIVMYFANIEFNVIEIRAQLYFFSRRDHAVNRFNDVNGFLQILAISIRTTSTSMSL